MKEFKEKYNGIKTSDKDGNDLFNSFYRTFTEQGLKIGSVRRKDPCPSKDGNILEKVIVDEDFKGFRSIIEIEG